MEIRLSNIVTISAGGEASSIVHHNHTGIIRERGECSACDQFYEFFTAPELTA